VSTADDDDEICGLAGEDWIEPAPVLESRLDVSAGDLVGVGIVFDGDTGVWVDDDGDGAGREDVGRENLFLLALCQSHGRCENRSDKERRGSCKHSRLPF
jgi:hypothetical protein